MADTEEIILRNVECRHRIPVGGSYGETKYILVFIDAKANTYYWPTNVPGPICDGDILSIKAKIDKQYNRLSYVRRVLDVESEQPDKSGKIDAEDIMLGLAHY